MDILNWLYLRKEQLIRTTANNPETDLIAIGADVTFAKRDDKYKTYAMPFKDLSVAGDVANTAYYTVDLNTTSVVNVTTQKGVIEITMVAPAEDPAANFATSVGLSINNVDMDFSNLDNVYFQVTPYYRSSSVNDTFIPYVLAVTANPGLNLEIFNASSVEIKGIAAVTITGSTTILAEANKIYTYLPSSSSPGTDATFTIIRNNSGDVDSVLITNTGSGYGLGDTVTILGQYVGGVTGVDDITLNVSTPYNTDAFEGRLYLYYELYNF
jgi:hypothetical protein